MKRILMLLAVVALLASCKKDKGDDNGPETYEQKLVGTWSLTGVTYKSQFPSLTPGGPTTPVDGEGEKVTGTFVIDHNPNTLSYDYSFEATLPLFGRNVDVPVSQKSSGTWTVSSDNSKIYLDLEEGETSTMEVITNTENKQVFRSIIPYELPILGVIEVEALITLEK